MLFKKNNPTDIQQVYQASAWLEKSEFQVFIDAWKVWYNETPSEKKMESYFVDFLEKGSVPFWVRNHVRFILNRKDLIEKEQKRLVIGVFTYYVPLLIFFILIMWAYYR